MNIRTFILIGILSLSGSVSLHAMDSETPDNSSSIQNIQKYVSIKKFFLELAALISLETTPTLNDAISLLATVRYEKIPELFEIDSKIFKKFFHLKKLQKFFQHYRVRTFKERMLSFQSCINFSALEDFFECADLENGVDLLIKLYCDTGTLEEKHGLAQRIQAIIETMLKSSEHRTISGVQKSALITSYIDCHALLKLVKDLAEGKEVPVHLFIETFNCNQLVTNSGADWKSYEPYCSLSKIISLALTCFSTTTSVHGPSFESLITCLRWDTLAQVLAQDLFEEHIDDFISQDTLKTIMRRLQAGELITAQELCSLISSKEILLYLHLQRFDWEECAKLLNETRQGKFHTANNHSLEKMSKLLELDIAEALDSSLPEDIQSQHITTLVDNCTNPDVFMRFHYALPYVGIPLGLWLMGHAICHPCMEAFEPQSWYTAGALALGTFYTTLQLSRFFTTPAPLKVVVVNAFATKALRLIQFFRKEGISKSDILTMAPQEDEGLKKSFKEFLEVVSYAQLDTLPTNRYELLKLFEDPLLFASTCSSFMETICIPEAPRSKEEYEKALQTLYAILASLLPEETLPYFPAYTAFLQCLDAPCKQSLESFEILPLAAYNPLILLGKPAFIKAVTASKVRINGIHLSAWLLTLISSYKDYIHTTQKTTH